MKSTAAEFEGTLQAEAARYALLMRLGPPLRHGLMGQIQILQFLAEMALRQAKPERGGSQTSDAIEKMPPQVALTRERCNALARWLRSDLLEIVNVEAVVKEVTTLLDVEFSLRERQLVVQCDLSEIYAPREPLIEVLAATLLTLSDETQKIGVFRVDAAMDRDAVVLRVSAQLQAEDTIGPAAPYRRLNWDDVRALARGTGIDLRIADREARITVQASRAPG